MSTRLYETTILEAHTLVENGMSDEELIEKTNMDSTEINDRYSQMLWDNREDICNECN